MDYTLTTSFSTPFYFKKGLSAQTRTGENRMGLGDRDEVKVVVFDLNGAFYNKSSKEEFFKFICRKKPGRLKYLLGMGYYYLLLKLHSIRQTEFKENFFNYLNGIPPSLVEEYAAEFWKREFPGNFNKEMLKRFEALRQQGVLILCATGGYELYVKPLFDYYKVDGFVGTRVKYEDNTYTIQGVACKEEEKIARLDDFFKDRPYKIVEAYSDSKEEILYKAEKAYLIKNGKVVPFSSED